MNYHLKSKPKNILNGKIIVVFVLFLILSLCIFLFPNVTRNISYTIAEPLWLIRDIVTNSFFRITNFFVTKNSLITKNMSLQNEIISLHLKEIDYDILLKENEDLKNITSDIKDKTRIVSRILSKPPFSPYDTLVIDVGTNNGIAFGDRVYVSDTIIVGTVTSVTSRTSLVTLFSTNGQKNQSTDSRTGTVFEIIGSGGTNFKMEVPKDADILLGDNFLYPSHFAYVLASVFYIDTNSQSSFKTIYLRIPGNVFSSQWVFIDKN